MRFIFALLGALLPALALMAGSPLAAQEFPARPEGPVLDAADILPPADEAALDAKLRAYNQTTGRALIIATVPDLGGETADVYAQQLAEAWDIGGATTEEGVLMLVAPQERKVWITTARGVQTRLTDVSTGRIVRDTIIPAFKAGDMPGGIAQGADAIIARLDMDPATAKAIDEAEAAAQAQRGDVSSSTIGGAIFWVVVIVFFMLVFGRRGARGRRSGMAGTVGDVILWTAINAAMNSRDSGGGGFGGGDSGGGGFGGFGGGGGGFNGGGAGGSW